MPKTYSLQKVKEFRDFIRSHHSAMTIAEMANQIGISESKTAKLKSDMRLSKPFKRSPVRHGKYFNVDATKNWLTGVQ